MEFEIIPQSNLFQTEAFFKKKKQNFCSFFDKLSQCVSSPIEAKQNFIDFPVEIFLIILKDLKLMDLIAVAKTHPYMQRVVEMSYKDKFSESQFVLKNYHEIIGRIEGNIYYELNFDSILDVFQIFGHLIPKIFVYYGPFENEPEKLRAFNEHISKYMVNSLTEASFLYFHDDCLLGLQVPFTTLETLTLSNVATEQINSNDMNFSAMFPVLRRLSLLGSSSYINPKSLEHHFPHLEFMEIGHELNEMDSILVFQRRLELNPQVRHLLFHRADWNVLEMISRNVPNIEQLEIFRFNASIDANDTEILFPNLKVFSVERSFGNVTRVPIVFGYLEKFSYDRSMELWVDVIIQNKHLKKLKTRFLTDNQFERMTDKFLDLEELTVKLIQITTHNSIATIEKFVERANKLKFFTILKTNSETSNALKNLLTPQWNVKESYGKLFFDRD